VAESAQKLATNSRLGRATLRVLQLIFGIALVTVILWDTFEVMLLPLPIRRHLRFVMLFLRGTWRAWRFIARSVLSLDRRERFLGIYGPLSLVLLIAIWVALLIVGFGLIHLALWRLTLPRSLYFSGITSSRLVMATWCHTRWQ
jgi:hypothetical protein